MLSSTRHALNHRHILPTSLHYRSYSKPTTASAVSKPTVTKKKYSELPALHPREYALISNTHHARHPHIPECASFAYPEYLRLYVNMVVYFSVIYSWNFELVFDFISAVVTV
jgi:hypothetical protein